MLSCLSEVDYETRTKVENYLARNLGGEDYNEFQSCKGKGRKSRPPQEAIIDRIQPEEATDYLPLPKKETPRITTTSPPERGWCCLYLNLNCVCFSLLSLLYNKLC